MPQTSHFSPYMMHTHPRIVSTSKNVLLVRRLDLESPGSPASTSHLALAVLAVAGDVRLAALEGATPVADSLGDVALSADYCQCLDDLGGHWGP
jgi:hypothetical protein